ncbi:LuxR family transcriptional regulator [Hyphomonas beringensis]|uniref:LuxR family transcriptional regulator n=1 Tax=Hyphomonas beringensis TaxID=1280946 RepID=UPI0009E077C8|nr:LuxR family transcriptional regulator [Hyphomonas beringensis]
MRISLRDFIERANDTEDTEALFRSFDQLVRQYGIDVSSYHILAEQLRRVPLEAGMIRHTFPVEWSERYLSEKYADIDPLLSQARSEAYPFHWFKVEDKMKLSQQQRVFLKELKQAGLRDGLAIPIFGPIGTMAFFGLGSMTGPLDLEAQDIAELQLACQYTHNTFITLSADFPIREPVPPLSPRETEILTLVAAGLSNIAIAEKLGITENTVDTILRRAFKKLGANNRITAVLKGIGSGLILPE